MNDMLRKLSRLAQNDLVIAWLTLMGILLLIVWAWP